MTRPSQTDDAVDLGELEASAHAEESARKPAGTNRRP